MSLFGAIGGALKSGLGGFLLGGPAGAALGAATSLLSGPRKLNGSSVGQGLAGLPTLPGAGVIGTGAAIGGTALGLLNITGKPMRKRRRSKGITASELKGFKRVACILSDYQKVKVQKNVKCAPKRRSSTCK